MKKVVFVLLIVFIFSFSFAFAKEFSDVAKDHWAYNYINELSNQGIVNGYSDGTYKPSGNVTRAEFLKLIVCTDKTRAMGAELAEYYSGGFDTWYAKYVSVARQIMTIDFGDNLNEPILRHEMARVIQDFAKRDMNVSDINTANEKKFTDIDVLNDTDKDAVLFVRSLGIIVGYDDNSFKPMNKMTRAEVATVISKYINNNRRFK